MTTSLIRGVELYLGQAIGVLIIGVPIIAIVYAFLRVCIFFASGKWSVSQGRPAGMGPYLDNMLSGWSFKTTSDGSRLFFPWGGLGRGYVIASERDYQRLRRQIKIFFTVSYVFILGVIWLPTYFIGIGAGKTDVAPAVIAVALMGVYGVWAWSLCRRLQPSNETLRRVSTQAHVSAVLLWLITLVFVFGALLWALSVLPS
jgi:hypothetical protein